jgi:hypothetical protein
MYKYLLGSSTLVLVSLLIAASCGERPDGPAAPTSAPAPEVQLMRFGACGTFFWASTAAGDIAVTFYIEARKRSTTQPLARELALPDSSVEVSVERGTDLPRDMCTDIPVPESVPTSSHEVTEGSAQITLEPRPSLPSGHASGTVRLTGVVADDGTRFAPITMTSNCIDCDAA